MTDVSNSLIECCSVSVCQHVSYKVVCMYVQGCMYVCTHMHIYLISVGLAHALNKIIIPNIHVTFDP